MTQPPATEALLPMVTDAMIEAELNKAKVAADEGGWVESHMDAAKVGIFLAMSAQSIPAEGDVERALAALAAWDAYDANMSHRKVIGQANELADALRALLTAECRATLTATPIASPAHGEDVVERVALSDIADQFHNRFGEIGAPWESIVQSIAEAVYGRNEGGAAVRIDALIDAARMEESAKRLNPSDYLFAKEKLDHARLAAIAVLTATPIASPAHGEGVVERVRAAILTVKDRYGRYADIPTEELAQAALAAMPTNADRLVEALREAKAALTDPVPGYSARIAKALPIIDTALSLEGGE